MTREVATQECPHCFTEIDARATVCPTCRRDIEDGPEKSKGGRCAFQAVGGLIGMVIAVALIFMIPINDLFISIGVGLVCGFVCARVGITIFDSL